MWRRRCSITSGWEPNRSNPEESGCWRRVENTPLLERHITVRAVARAIANEDQRHDRRATPPSFLPKARKPLKTPFARSGWTPHHQAPEAIANGAWSLFMHQGVHQACLAQSGGPPRGDFVTRPATSFRRANQPPPRPRRGRIHLATLPPRGSLKDVPIVVCVRDLSTGQRRRESRCRRRPPPATSR